MGIFLAERRKITNIRYSGFYVAVGFDYTDWQRYTAIELYAAQAGIAVVMPSAYYSGYMDTIHGDYKYFSVITDEISKLAVKLFPLSEKKRRFFVAGFSMGGYGAFKVGDAQRKSSVLWVFSGWIGIVPHEPVHYKENEIGLRRRKMSHARKDLRQ